MRNPSACRASGAVLPVALVFLILLTFMTLRGMNVLVLNERMAGNLLERQAAYQAASGALLQLRGQLTAQTDATNDSDDGSSGVWSVGGLWNGESAWAPNLGQDQYWWDAHARSLPEIEPGDVSVQYILEYLGTVDDASALESRLIYRITARAAGPGAGRALRLQAYHVVPGS